MGHLVEDELGADLALLVGRRGAEELPVAVRHASPVLHGPAEVGDEHLVVALLRERHAELLPEERQALPGEGDQLVEVALEVRHQRLAAVEAEVVAVVLPADLVERPGVDHHDVRRERGSVGESPDPHVLELGLLDRVGRGVGGDLPARRREHGEPVRRLEVGLVEAGPQAPGLVGLQARPDVDELVGRVDRAEDALAGGRVGRLGLDDQDVALGEVR